MTDQRISVAYFLCHPPADLDAIKSVVESLRLKAIDLGFHQVGELVFLANEDDMLSSVYGLRFRLPFLPTAACYFAGEVGDGDPAEFGLRLLPLTIELDGLVIPYGDHDWTSSGNVQTRDLNTFSKLMCHAAEIGIWATMSFGDTMITFSKDEAGKVKIEEEGEIPGVC
jgi:hypothetical protein